jgi:hypothetical protein
VRVASLLRPSQTPIVQLALGIALLMSATSASAISIHPPAGSGLGQDDDTEIYCPCDLDPNPTVNRHIATIREAFDGIATAVPHEWGIYFADDPTHLIPVFTAEDHGPSKPVATVDFDNGIVTDVDSLTVEFTFDPRVAHYGFYLKVEVPSGPPILTYSQAALNGGVDTFGSFPTLGNSAYRVVAFEVNGAIVALEAVAGACPVVPEPSVALLLGGGLALLSKRRRS